MDKMDTSGLENWYNKNHEKKISGRYIPFSKISSLIKNLSDRFQVEPAGKSFLGNPVFKISAGSGKIKILLWSQMHGNETSGTKALFDLFNFLDHPGELQSVRDEILKNCTLIFIPMLNPDGAAAYTRVNAQEIDLNRDAIDLKAPESRILRSVLDSFNPDYCFNLHDQRTVFTAGTQGETAVLSFLAPSEGVDRAVTDGRKETMKVISSMYSFLKQFIPGQIGKYTDEFYPTATGDNFQKEGFYTILIESGHYKGDYQRENTRKFTFMAVLQGIYSISEGLKNVDYKNYFNIPENAKNHLDLILKDINIDDKVIDIGILYKERLKNTVQIELIPEIDKKGDLSTYIADNVIYKKDLFFKDEKELMIYIKKYTRLL